jgi:hypothetical protein
MKFLLRKDSQIIVATDVDNEIKTFLFKCSTGWLEEIRDLREGFDEDLFEDLRKDLHFFEFLIQLFREQYDVFIASIDFEIGDEEYRFSDVSGEYTYWIDSQEPRIIIDEDHGRIEMDIYQFDQYEHYFGMDKENYEFNLLGKSYNEKDRY